MLEYIPRALARTVRRALLTFPAVLVTGARQTGKTTLLREEFGAGYAYVSLDRPDVRARALADPVAFFADHSPPAILDEIQHAPELLPYLKEQIDRSRRPGQWILSGSQSFPLMRGVSETLAGRIAILTLDPLATDEFLRRLPPVSVDARLDRVWGGLRSDPDPGGRLDIGQWLLRGGFPELALNPAVERRLWLGSYVQSYLERDVRDLVHVGDLSTFGRFLGLAAARSGQLLNMTDLARDAGVSGPTVRRWLSVLEASQLVHLLRPFHKNLGKRLVKSPKIYILDPGLVSFLLGLHTVESILQGPAAGALIETAVVAEWVKAFREQGETPPLYFWRASSGLEVDLVIERNDRLYGLEVKATSTPLPGHAESLAQWLVLAGPEARGALACRVDVPTALRPGLRAVPWHLAW